MYNIYVAAPIDTCLEEALKQIEEFKLLFAKFPKLNVYGAGYKNSPVLDGSESPFKKGVICSYDLRKLRESDVLLVVTNLKQFAAGTFMELEYSRQLGIYTIIFIVSGEKPKNIFLETYANKIIYSYEELNRFLEELNNG